jgi:hypothetical protein
LVGSEGWTKKDVAWLEAGAGGGAAGKDLRDAGELEAIALPGDAEASEVGVDG